VPHGSYGRCGSTTFEERTPEDERCDGSDEADHPPSAPNAAAAKAPTTPNVAVRTKPKGPFRPGATSRAITPAVRPSKAIQKMVTHVLRAVIRQTTGPDVVIRALANAEKLATATAVRTREFRVALALAKTPRDRERTAQSINPAVRSGAVRAREGWDRTACLAEAGGRCRPGTNTTGLKPSSGPSSSGLER
jgi:hypothetical protein